MRRDLILRAWPTPVIVQLSYAYPTRQRNQTEPTPDATKIQRLLVDVKVNPSWMTCEETRVLAESAGSS